MINIFDIAKICGVAISKDILLANEELTVERVVYNGYIAITPDFRRVKATQWLLVVAGELTITVGNIDQTLTSGESVTIESGRKFRIDSTRGALPCVVIIVYGSRAKEG